MGKLKKERIQEDAPQLIREVIPYHEAAHAVTAWSLGLAIKYVSAKPRGRSLGRCQHIARGDNYPAKHLLVLLAGEAAAEKILPGSGHVGAGRDRRTACRRALVMAKRDKKIARQLLRQNCIEVQAIVDRNWNAILDLVSELEKRGRLSGRQATRIITQPLLLTGI